MTAALLLAVLCQSKVDPKKVDEAVERGGNILLIKAGEGLPKEVNYNVGGGHTFDELVFYTLVHAGVDPNDKTFDKLLRQMLTCPLRRTYQVSLIAMALYALDPAKYQQRIAECCQFLVDLQADNGQWDYGMQYAMPPIPRPVATPDRKDTPTQGTGEVSPPPPPKPKSGALPKVPVKRSRRGNAVGDNSNSQYAAMGLRACVLAGCEIEKEVSEKAVAWWEKCQLEDGSWNYCFQGVIKKDEPGYGSMTAGGVASLVIFKRVLSQDYKGHKAVKAGMDWLGRNFTVTDNPKEPGSPKRWLFYYLYALERVGDLYGTEKIGSHAWYETGAEELLRTQSGGGMWTGPVRDFHIADTCFAILFLRRATKQPPKVATK
jgi:hypothetical protein